MTQPTILLALPSAHARVDEVRNSSLELITLARSLGRVDVVTMGAPSTEVLALLGLYDVEAVHQAALPTAVPEEQQRVTSNLAAVMVAAARKVHADVLLLPNGFAFKEIGAVAALRLKAGLVTDAAGVRWDAPGVLHVAKRVFGGTWDTVAEVRTDPAVVTVQANTVVAEPVGVGVGGVGVGAGGAGIPRVEALLVDLPPCAVTVKSREVSRKDEGRPDLEEASVVVAGGRGVNGDFGPVEELADVLGGAVGATRDAVFEGWFDRYIGQTGVTVAPAVYVAAGISGMPHHVSGITGSGQILAVNNDSDAPIFEMSDFGVVGDLAAVLPQAAETIRAWRAGREG
ncbi:MAG: electron transfer flavoprotein subunit alpha/FixB family protein [Cellulomonadaceae bacterium]|jgi:electron transfer flavoprotein alpha subunit|nr:electron transfer flavoprotein subunit alpha/FixB family protein [Cellulomonadaceae bacterium]